MSEETITITRAEYEELQSLKKKNEELNQQIEYLLEEFHLAQKQEDSIHAMYHCIGRKKRQQRPLHHDCTYG